jgi:hypothetical protein
LFISNSTKANLGFSNFLLLASGSLDSYIAVLLVLIGTQRSMGDLTELVVNIVNWSVIYRTGQLFTGQIFTGQLFTGQIFTGQIFTGQIFTGLVRTSDWSDIYWSVIYWSDNYLTTGQISYKTPQSISQFQR